MYELAEVGRREDLTDEKAQSRVQGITLSLQRLKSHEPQVVDEPPLIAKLPVRQAEAMARAAENLDREQHQQRQEQPCEGVHEAPSQHECQLTANDLTLCLDESRAVAMDVDENVAESMSDDESDEDVEDVDVCWVPDDEDDEQIADEFDGYYQPEEKDIEELDKDKEQGDDETVTVESSGAQIRRLFTVVKILVHSPHLKHEVTAEDVRRALLKNMSITDKELSVVRDLTNWLRPFAPKRVQTSTGKYRDHTGHVVTCSAMVVIAQAFLDAIALHTFKRRICPQSHVGSGISLQLSSVVLYELFGTGAAGQFDIQDPAGNIITSAADAASPGNKQAVVASFFNLENMQTICKNHNLEFDDRFVLSRHPLLIDELGIMAIVLCIALTRARVLSFSRLIFTNRFSLHLQGNIIPHGPQREGYPAESALERRTRKSHGRSATSWIWKQELDHWRELTHDQIEKAASDSAEISKIKATVLKESKTAHLDPQIINRYERELAQAKREGYYWSKLEKASKKRHDYENCKAPVPIDISWQNHQVEEEPARIQLRHLIHEASVDPNKVVSWAGGDPGIRVMLEAVPQTTHEIETHLSRFHALYGKQASAVVNRKLRMKSLSCSIQPCFCSFVMSTV